MNISRALLPLLGASCLAVFATAAPAQAASKPCCYNNGEYFQSSPSTCRNYGGRVVEQEYCVGGYYGDRGYRDRDYRDRDYGGPSFAIQLGDIVIAYSDGYYDRHRRWHRWRNDRERRWYQQNRRASYYNTLRDRDRDRNRRDWRDGRRDDWR